MILQIYPLNDRDVIPWKLLNEAFSECYIIKDPQHDYEGHWILKHSTQDIRFYAPVSGLLRKSCNKIHFEYDDVAQFWFTGGSPEHPLWSGIFSLLKSVKILLVAEPPGRGTPVAQAVLVSDNALVQDFPTWVDERYLVFVCPTFGDFQRVIISGWELSHQFIESSESKTRWADCKEHDAETFKVFENFITGKRGARKRYSWDGKAVKPDQSSGSFLDAYGIWVDWRDFDSSIVSYFSEVLKNEQITCEETETALVISYKGKTVDISYDDIGKERYNTIRTLNKALAPDYEIRVLSRSVDGDTHCFLFAPTWLWRDLESAHSEQLSKKAKVIAPEDGFV